MWDQYKKEYFTLKAIIIVCIHDAPGGFTISGQTKEKGGCPVCVDVLFVWMELHQLTFHHLENWCSCDTDGSWRENISSAR
jgi:hypothetical protein